MIKCNTLPRITALAVICLVAWTLPLPAQESSSSMIGDSGDGNLSQPVHLIKIYDKDAGTIFPDSDRPFSTKQTCGRCHDYDKISHGRHFNAAEENIDPGHKGEPWIYWDCAAATQIPLSYRNWEGTYKPQQVGLSDWDFTQVFSRHFPGGSVADPSGETVDPIASRWNVSGTMEINCLACHDAEPFHDQAQCAIQLAEQNFGWANTATSSFAWVTGSVKKLPDHWVPEDGSLDYPAAHYDASRFNGENKVQLNLTRAIPNERCYFCHSTSQTHAERTDVDEDIHLKAGLTCVDCHRNIVDHNINRGYEGEMLTADKPAGTTLTCEGCHLGSDDPQNPDAGRLGSPKPKHAGIPTVHFEKLACTACHSGPWPTEAATFVKTSRAHSLGLQTVNKAPDALPHILSPVLAELPPLDPNSPPGKIAPHKMLWPAFWAQLKEGEVVPLDPEEVKQVASSILLHGYELPASVTWPEMPEENLADGEVTKPEMAEKEAWFKNMITQVLTILKGQPFVQGTAVYICGGKMYQLNDAGALVSQENAAAQPYLWPLAHDVRPASQSLGVRGCPDCHTNQAPFFQAALAVDSPLPSDRDLFKRMINFLPLDETYVSLFNSSFVFRPMLKTVAFAASAFIAAILLLYCLRGLTVVAALASGSKIAAAEPIVPNSNRWYGLLKKLIYLAGLLCFLILAGTGFYAFFVTGKPMTGYLLMLHCTVAPPFMICLALLVLLGAHSSRFLAATSVCPLRKLCFWLIGLLALPVMLSSVLSMFNLFGTTGQFFLYHAHQYTTIALAVLVVIHTLLTLTGTSKK